MLVLLTLILSWLTWAGAIPGVRTTLYSYAKRVCHFGRHCSAACPLPQEHEAQRQREERKGEKYGGSRTVRHHVLDAEHAEIEEIDGVGHSAHIEKPALIAQRMISFFTKKRLHE